MHVKRMSIVIIILFSTVVKATTFTTQAEKNRVVEALYTESDYAASLISIKYKQKNSVIAVMQNVEKEIKEIKECLNILDKRAANLLKFKQRHDMKSVVFEQQRFHLLLKNKKTKLIKLKEEHFKKLMKYNDTIKISIKNRKKEMTQYMGK